MLYGPLEQALCGEDGVFPFAVIAEGLVSRTAQWTATANVRERPNGTEMRNQRVSPDTDRQTERNRAVAGRGMDCDQGRIRQGEGRDVDRPATKAGSEHDLRRCGAWHSSGLQPHSCSKTSSLKSSRSSIRTGDRRGRSTKWRFGCGTSASSRRNGPTARVRKGTPALSHSALYVMAVQSQPIGCYGTLIDRSTFSARHRHRSQRRRPARSWPVSARNRRRGCHGVER